MPDGGPSITKRCVLVVEDERDLADLYTEWLTPRFDAEAVYSGEEALEVVDRDWDAALLDRRMPNVSGDEVLSEIRTSGFQYPVAMVTAVQPDFDIIEMGFDDYIIKPVTKENLHETVEQLIDLVDYDSAIQRYFSLASKKAALEATKTAPELQNHPQYQALQRRLDQVKERVDADRDGFFEGETVDGVFQERLRESNRA